MSRPALTAPIASVTNLEQFDILASTGLTLPDSALETLDAASRQAG